MNQAALKPRGSSASLRKTLKRVNALAKKNRFQEARSHCEVAFLQGAQSPEFLHLYGMMLKACGQLEDALVKTYAAHEVDPEDAKILNSLGLIFLDMNDIETAADMFKRATTTDEKLYEAWVNLGASLRHLTRYHAAELAFKCAYFLDNSKPETLFQIALMHIDVGQYANAAEIMDDIFSNHKNITASMKLKRLEIAMLFEDLEYVETHQDKLNVGKLNIEEQSILGGVRAQYHMIHDQFDEASAILENTIKLGTSSRVDHTAHLGFCYGQAGRFDDGIALLKGLLEEVSDHAVARHNLALLQFRKGELAEGFKNYEARWQLSELTLKHQDIDVPMWQGEPLSGKHILIWREQGVGDEVRYASLLPELQNMGCAVTYECMPKLAPLWEQSFPWATIRSEEKENADSYDNQFDFQLPIGSLGSFFRASHTAFEENQKPWIKRSRDVETQIRDQLAMASDELLIGVCWRSKNRIASRDKVFLNCEQLAPFAELSNARWLNVQYASTDEEIDIIRQCGLNIHHYTNLDQMDDLIGACNLLGACDLVISVGGAVGDLAGGVGTPMVYMTREYSEAFLGTDHVPWFKHCKSYPIKAYQADETVGRIVDDWQEIWQWAENLRSEERKSGLVSKENVSAAPLDLEYSAERGVAQ